MLRGLEDRIRVRIDLLLPRVQTPHSTGCRNHPVDAIVVGQSQLDDVHNLLFHIRVCGGKVLAISEWFHWLEV